MPTLSDLRATPSAVVRAERLLRICLRPDLPATIYRLQMDLSDAAAQVPTPSGDEDSGPRRLVTSPEQVRVDEIVAKLQALTAEQLEHEGDLLIRATEDGKWRQFVDAHPPRKDGEEGHARDEEVSLGFCNSDALLDALGTYAYSWDGEPLAADDWSLLAARISYADKKEAARAVVTMHELAVDFSKWRTDSSASLSEYVASRQLARAESAPDASPAGSPDAPPAATTEAETKSD